MKLVQINTVCNGSTGKIMGDIQRTANQEGFETISFYGRRKGYKDLKCEKIGGFFSFWYHVFLTTVFDMHGHGSYFKTKKLVKRIKQENPDIIHLHNIHGYYINYKVLFNYLKNEYQGKIFWTLHDCLPFTGHCAHFMSVNCDKWKIQCKKCPKKKRYPISLFLDRSYKNYLEKKELFTNLNNLIIITPSDWLNKLVKQSFLKDYEVITINNGINLNLFKENKDLSVLEKYNIPNNKIILGVASVWTKEKGIDDFIDLAKLISDEYIIILVGLSKKQIRELSKYKNIIGIKRTDNQQELVKLYSCAYVLVNPTYEDNYPTVNLEAIACNTPVITYATGGCVEQVTKETGIISNKDNLLDDIEKIKDLDFNNKELLNKMDKEIKNKEIIELYRK